MLNNFFLILNLLLCFIIFLVWISFLGIILERRSLLYIIFFFEFIYMVINILFLLISIYYNLIFGFLFSFFLLVFAALETCVGFCLLILMVNILSNTKLKGLTHLKN